MKISHRPRPTKNVPKSLKIFQKSWTKTHQNAPKSLKILQKSWTKTHQNAQNSLKLLQKSWTKTHQNAPKSLKILQKSWTKTHQMLQNLWKCFKSHEPRPTKMFQNHWKYFKKSWTNTRQNASKPLRFCCSLPLEAFRRVQVHNFWTICSEFVHFRQFLADLRLWRRTLVHL